MHKKYEFKIKNLLVFILPFTLYLFTICASVPVQDPGELITAGFTLGIPHPPGYPLFCIITKLISVLIPFSNIAFRINLSSAIFSATTVFLLYLIISVRLSSLAKFISAISCLLLAVTNAFWSQAIVAEVYSLNSLFVVATLVLVGIKVSRHQGIKAEDENNGIIETSNFRNPFLLFFIFGLSLCNHHTMILFVPVILVSNIWIVKNRRFDYLLFANCCLLFFLALSIYLYLPIRSLTNPPMDWGNPQTLTLLKNHILRQQYKPLGAGTHSLLLFIKQIGVYLKYLWNELRYFLIVLLFTPFFYKKIKFLIVLSLVFVIGIILITNFKIIPFEINQVKAFFTPTLIIIIAAASFILTSFKKTIHRFLILCFCTILLLLFFTKNIKSNNKGREIIAYKYAVDLLNSVPENSVLIVTGDFPTFPLSYVKLAEKQRPTVYVFDNHGNVFQKQVITEKLMKNVKNIYHSIGINTSDVKNVKSCADGLAYKVSLGDYYSKKIIKKWRRLSFGRPYTQELKQGTLTRYLVNQYYSFALAESLFLYDREFSIRLYKKIIMDPSSSETMIYTIGKIMEKENLIKDAEECYRIGIKKINWSPKPHFYMANLLSEEGRNEEAITHYKKAIKIDPFFVPAIKNLSATYLEIGEKKLALEETKKAIKLKPSDFQLYYNLGAIYYSMGSVSSALEAFEKANLLATDITEKNAIRKTINSIRKRLR